MTGSGPLNHGQLFTKEMKKQSVVHPVLMLFEYCQCWALSVSSNVSVEYSQCRVQSVSSTVSVE